jgi:hypothetical protein
VAFKRFRDAWPTFGFRLYDSNDEQPYSIEHVPDILKAMLTTMMRAHDLRSMATTKVIASSAAIRWTVRKALVNRRAAADCRLVDSAVWRFTPV